MEESGPKSAIVECKHVQLYQLRSSCRRAVPSLQSQRSQSRKMCKFDTYKCLILINRISSIMTEIP